MFGHKGWEIVKYSITVGDGAGEGGGQFLTEVVVYEDVHILVDMSQDTHHKDTMFNFVSGLWFLKLRNGVARPTCRNLSRIGFGLCLNQKRCMMQRC